MSATPAISPQFTDEERAEIEQQLERMVNDAHFSHSRRFPPFLRYVVSETLAGNTDQLKERTLGIEIFGKEADYDTASEPIVRVTAAEIRKRIAQYYQEPGHEHEMRVALPPGSYVPQFEFPRVASTPQTLAPGGPPSLADQPSIPGTIFAPPHTLHRYLWVGLAVVLLLAGCSAFALLWHRSENTAFNRFWDPILDSPDPVLFSVADQTRYASLTLRDASDPSHLVELKDNLTAVVIDDLSVITKIAGVLQSRGHHYNLRGENATALSDLRAGPAVIVGAFDNAWTLRLLAPLRFHFANDPAMTTFSIIDSQPSGHASWTVHREQQLATNNYEDYAIVARYTDTTTGEPTLIAAGIGRGGTIAAGEFLTTPNLLQQVISRQPTGTHNVEVVLSTQIINGEPGTPTVAAVHFW